MTERTKQNIIGAYWRGVSMWTLHIHNGCSYETVHDLVHNDPTFNYNKASRE